MFASVFRDFVACRYIETTFEVDVPTLHRLEMVYPLPGELRRAVLKRQVEFLAGRSCARQAIAVLTGCSQVVIPQQSDRSPGWPAGIVGTITHTAGYAAALVAPATLYAGLGIDCEQVVLPDQLPLQRHICTPNELGDLQAGYSLWSPAELLTLVFSAKESLYKCLYPQVQTYFGFEAARVIALDLQERTFIIQLEKDLCPALPVHAQWTGSFARYQHLLMTAIVLPKSTPGAQHDSTLHPS
jgi:enterobactin synthetase component D